MVPIATLVNHLGTAVVGLALRHGWLPEKSLQDIYYTYRAKDVNQHREHLWFSTTSIGSAECA